MLDFLVLNLEDDVGGVTPSHPDTHKLSSCIGIVPYYLSLTTIFFQQLCKKMLKVRLRQKKQKSNEIGLRQKAKIERNP